MDTTGVQSGGSGATPTDPYAGSNLPGPKFSAASNAAWLKFAQQMFPNDPDPGQYVGALQQNLMSMINTTISEMNARNQAASDYAKKVAEGSE
jgi:hypothetical protein